MKLDSVEKRPEPQRECDVCGARSETSLDVRWAGYPGWAEMKLFLPECDDILSVYEYDVCPKCQHLTIEQIVHMSANYKERTEKPKKYKLLEEINKDANEIIDALYTGNEIHSSFCRFARATKSMMAHIAELMERIVQEKK